MPVPTHRAGCQTMIWRTNCPDCHKPVWFFSCTCGSKVFFDSKGDPWPLHADSCPVYHARIMINSGSDPRDIRRLLDSHAKVSGVSIPVELDQYLSEYGAPGKIYYNEELPSDEACEIEARVYQINKINFFKRFELDDNLIIRRIFGELVNEPYTEVVAREEPVQRISLRKQWTFVIPSREIQGQGLRVGMTIYATLQGRPIVDDLAVWVARDIDWK